MPIGPEAPDGSIAVSAPDYPLHLQKKVERLTMEIAWGRRFCPFQPTPHSQEWGDTSTSGLVEESSWRRWSWRGNVIVVELAVPKDVQSHMARLDAALEERCDS